MTITPTSDARENVARLKPQLGEDAESFAARCYSMQMQVYSAWAMSDLETPWTLLTDALRKSWIKSTAEQFRVGPDQGGAAT